MWWNKKSQPKIEESIDEKRISISGIEILSHKRGKKRQENGQNVFSNILQAVDASFNCFKHFVGLQNV